MSTFVKKDSGKTVLDAVIESLNRAASFNRDVQVAPAAILWPDKDGQWSLLAPVLSRILPHYLILGEYDPSTRTGPAIWLKCMIAKTLPYADWAGEVIPVIYLPGVSRQELRAIESCDPLLQPLAELQYRGVFWSQVSGRDWTIPAFLKSKDGGLGLDVAADGKTRKAMKRALIQLVETPVANLEGIRLDAAEFDQLLTPDPVRDLLRWMDDPERVRKKWTDEKWDAFCSVCVTDYSFNPQTDGELTAAEKIAEKMEKWGGVWKRFEESPRLYPHLPDLLSNAAPAQNKVFPDNVSWPQTNRTLESNLMSGLTALKKTPAHEAVTELKKLEKSHSERRKWVWATLDQAPLALSMEHLAVLARITERPLGGTTIKDMSRVYIETAWQADVAVLKALICVRQASDAGAVISAIRSVYLPWVKDAAARFQDMVENSSYPGNNVDMIESIGIQDGECLMFSDGLRFDVGQLLKDELEGYGYQISLSSRWASLPTVTSTAKAAVSPVSHLIAGSGDSQNFEPNVAETGKPLNSYNFNKLLKENDIQVLKADETGDPSKKAWTEQGNLDHKGHDEGWKLAWRIDEEIQSIAGRVRFLVLAGWQKIRIVTDHGWILMPGGLPKTEMPKFLTETRWGRCAILKKTAISSVFIVPWRWTDEVNVALAPHISCFKSGMEYAHGGLSLQECLTPVLTITHTGERVDAGFDDIIWRGLRCKLKVTGDHSDIRADIRTKASDRATSILTKEKKVGEDGRVSLLVEDDRYEGTAAFIVLVNKADKVIAKISTTVGGE
jgi:hypothetical protein